MSSCYYIHSMLRRKKIKKQLIKKLILIAFIGGFFSAGILLLWASTLKIPDIKAFEQRKIEQSTKIYDRTGEVLLYDVHQNIQRTVIPLVDMSRHIKNATVAIEDAQFYEHYGVRPLATFRAVFLQPLRGKGVQGGSTITQQVVKNTILTSERKISRKLKEWILAFKLEQNLSKEKILELYLNESPYGGNLYGIAEASESFFDKNSSELTLGEAAYLAALPQAPTFYSPYGNHTDELIERKNLVLTKMLENEFITEDEYEDAKNSEVIFQQQEKIGIQAPHFVFYIREYLEEKYGKRAVEEQGFKVITTLNFELQEKAEKIVKEFALQNKENFNAENAGLVAVDPKTGQILVMVGSRDYFDEEIDGNFNVTLGFRQPGSAFKPFVYAAALKKGYTPDTVVFDVKTQFQSTCEPDNLTNDVEELGEEGEGLCYSPGNYDNIFRGPVTLRDALAQSINIPAIKVLYLAGLSDSLRTAKDLGISTLTDINRYGLTLVLGGGEVTLLDITSAYGVFANDGKRNPPVGILRIEDGGGKIIEEFTKKEARVLPEQVARQISDILSDNVARTPAFGTRSPLYFENYDVAAKTGTTNDYRDAWTLGYSPNIAVGAWAGNNDNSSMEKKVAGFIITPLWHAFMQEALTELETEKFKKPATLDVTDLKPILKGLWQGGIPYIIDKASGKLATVYTPLELQEEKVVADVHSILNWIDKSDPKGPSPEFPARDTQYEFWEYGVEKWKEKSFVELDDIIPTEFDDVHGPQFAPKIIIENPKEKSVFAENTKVVVLVKNESSFPISRVDYFVNDMFIGSTKKEPFAFSFIPSELDVVASQNILKVVGYDSVLNKGEQQVTFTVIR